MTVASEMIKKAARLEWFITIEGCGWASPGTWNPLTFTGDVWANNDHAGGLTAVLPNATVHRGLELPGSIGWRVDPRTGQFDPGGLSFSIIDHDDWWVENLTPRRVGETATLYSKMEFNSECYLYTTTDSPFTIDPLVDDAFVWIGGRELVKISDHGGWDGTKDSYYCIRGKYGTPIGSNIRRPEDYVASVWPAGTGVYQYAPFWYNRKVALWAHVPGEAASACSLLWLGKLRGAKAKTGGGVFEFTCSGDFLGEANRLIRPCEWVVMKDLTMPVLSNVDDKAGDGSEMRRELVFAGPETNMTQLTPSGGTAPTIPTPNGLYALAAAYQYRTEPGGTDTMVTAWRSAVASGTAPQALIASGTDYVLRSFVQCGDQILEMYKRDNHASNTDPRRIDASIVSDKIGLAVGQVAMAEANAIGSGSQALGVSAMSKARFLLDNWQDQIAYSRFGVNGIVRRNVVDVLLIFLLSCDRELRRFDSVNAGSSTTVVETGAANFIADDHIGHALFCVEGTNKWEARPITDNSTTGITVGSAFSNVPADGKEYQIRNSVYDVLPLGWGLGIDGRFVDTSSFETMRDHYFQNVTLGRFLLGNQGEIDLWKFLQENILLPYGIVLYVDKATGKLCARYCGQNMGDGVMEDYLTITQTQFKAPGELDYAFVNPVGCVSLTVRGMESRVVGIENIGDNLGGSPAQNGLRATVKRVPSLLGGTTVTYNIRAQDIENGIGDQVGDSLDLKAMLDTEETASTLLGRIGGMVSEYSIPPPTWSGELDHGLYTQLDPCRWVSMTWNNPAAPINPFTGARGWTSVYGRVLAASLPLNEKSLTCKVSIELLGTTDDPSIARIAPACTISTWASDAHGDYWTVGSSDFVADADADKDYYHFAVGDKLHWYDATGDDKGYPVLTISGFGSNFAATPQAAADARIYVTGKAGGEAAAAGDYCSFAEWSAGNTARMDLYSAYADSAGDLDGGLADDAKVYS